jgi:hypothetical protein
MERDIERLSPAMRAAILEAGRILDGEIEAHSQFSFATFRMGGEEHTAYYVIRRDAEGVKRFAFEILID